jgi:leader peptidase (prepilin peptidase)/N-methyltransferase
LIYEYIPIFVLGAVVGSFLNVCIHRLPKEQSIVTPGSHCPGCENPIPFYDNVPILSYLLLQGKCRFCKTSISARYPFVEFLSGLVSIALLYKFDFTLDFIAFFIFLLSLIVITFIDLDEKIIPNEISLPGIVLGLIFSPFISTLTFRESFLGVIVGGGVLAVVALAYYGVTKREGMGGGDIKLLAMIGAFLGWNGAFISLFFGSLLGAFIGVFFMIKEGKDTKYALPFGPFLALGAVVYLFFGDNIINWYVAFAGLQ